MTGAEVDLAALFSEVAKTLKANQASLNEADAYNHNHGDNMVKNFKVISKALKLSKGEPPSEQLAYASQALRTSSSTGSARLYADGLARAASQFQGQSTVNEKNALSLVQALLGGGQSAQPSQPAQGDMMGGLMGALLGGASGPQSAPASSGDAMGDLMGALLGGAAGSQGPQPSQSGDAMGDLMGALLGGAAGSQTPQQPQSGDAMGDLMGALLGGDGGPSPSAQSSQAEGGLNLGTLLTAGMAFFQAQQQGASTMEALISAVMAGSQMNSTPHQSQSGQLVAGTLLNALGSILGGKK